LMDHQANPGGQLDPKLVIGRDNIIRLLWDTLEQQSVRMNAERRIGKTSIIRKMCAEPREGWVPIFQDLEQFHSAGEFAMGVYREVARFLTKRKLANRWANELLTKLGGTEVAGIIRLPGQNGPVPWKEILNSTVKDLVTGCEQQQERLLFLWDEVPFMLDNIKNNEGEDTAMQVLDTLRGLRQTYGARNLRMIITGSIGIHHVIHSLKEKGYANSPLNDTFAITVTPLAEEDAMLLAERLISGEAIATEPETYQETITAIAKLADSFPFYIHHIVKNIKLSQATATPEMVEQTVKRQLLSADDPWELNHYRERLGTYYGQSREGAAIAVLDALASTENALSTNDLLRELKGIGALDEREPLIKLLRLMEQDHYLRRNDDGHYYFQFPLLRRWWHLSRGL
ncbi:MAG: hypothetical protein ACPG4N_09810, partial [Gammaproteobacteria bacterium]